MMKKFFAIALTSLVLFPGCWNKKEEAKKEEVKVEAPATATAPATPEAERTSGAEQATTAMPAAATPAPVEAAK